MPVIEAVRSDRPVCRASPAMGSSPANQGLRSLDARISALGQPIGASLGDWNPPTTPPRTIINGQSCQLVPLDELDHGHDLYIAFAADSRGSNWTYLPHGPFDSYVDFRKWLRWAHESVDPLFFSIVESSKSRATGIASFLRMDTVNGSIEVGYIHFSEELKRTRAATEAMYLMMKRAFELGYRRYEWKCDALNAPSRAAAKRLGFRFEGLCRQAVVYKGRSRDTAWYSIIDADWPVIEGSFRKWLSAANFTPGGQQIHSLSQFTARHSTDVVSVV